MGQLITAAALALSMLGFATSGCCKASGESEGDPNPEKASTAGGDVTPRAASNWGAIATSEGTTVYGLALNQPSATAAKAAAKARCGRPNCKVEETFPQGHCVVVSTINMNSKLGVAWGNEPTMTEAIKALTGICNKHKLQCPVVASGCSDGIARPSVLGGGSVPAVKPPIKKFKAPPRPKKSACQNDSDCPSGTKCVVYRCPGCNKCEKPSGGGGGDKPEVWGLGHACGSAEGYCGAGLTCDNTTLRCVRE